ncbi:DUF4288 domain-containing protein [Rhodococcus qingshengii]|uniref:DUF4288 domain-containing protein n=1 Tax=Rhodococcus qingshengii TaxID=334542 RepID=UPI0021BB6633|nr:DUF4288 domain-containing protein [Rhodococcus qingshengii]UXF70015.1 DUF4288 domain-containing protein [Rhodococcus qingshengii]
MESRAYFGIAVFELGTVDGTGSFYREDSYLICAADDVVARIKFEGIAREQEYEAGTAEDKSYVRLAHLVDLAPVLSDLNDDASDLYSRHFASLTTYTEFEMKLGGRPPLC